MLADVDNNPFTFNSFLSLFDSTGTLIAFDENSIPADPGSANGFDAFLGRFTLPATQTYYLAISTSGYFPVALSQTFTTSNLFRPDGANGGVSVMGTTPNSLFANNGSATGSGTYTLNVTLEAVPEPATVLFGAALLSAAGLSRPRRQVRTSN